MAFTSQGSCYCGGVPATSGRLQSCYQLDGQRIRIELATMNAVEHQPKSRKRSAVQNGQGNVDLAAKELAFQYFLGHIEALDRNLKANRDNNIAKATRRAEAHFNLFQGIANDLLCQPSDGSIHWKTDRCQTTCSGL